MWGGSSGQHGRGAPTFAPPPNEIGAAVTTTPEQEPDAGAKLLQTLRDEDWSDEDLQMLRHLEVTTLRKMALNYVRSLIEHKKKARG